jgi:hypothetical protein
MMIVIGAWTAAIPNIECVRIMLTWNITHVGSIAGTHTVERITGMIMVICLIIARRLVKCTIGLSFSILAIKYILPARKGVCNLVDHVMIARVEDLIASTIVIKL